MKKLVIIGLLACAAAFGQWSDFSSLTASGNLSGAMNGKPTVQSFAGNPNGNLACNKAGWDHAWDTSNGRYYIGSTCTGNAGTSVWVELPNFNRFGPWAFYVNPMTTAGDMLYWNGTALARLATPGNGTFCPSFSGGVVSFIACPGSTGGISSIGLTMPGMFAVSTPNPLTANGTFTVTLNTQSANQVFAGPTTGSAAAPGFRGLVAADIPSLNYQAPITTGTQDQVLNGTLGLTSLVNCVAAGGVYQYSTTSHTFSCHTLAAADITVAGTLTNNTSGTAAGLSGASALPNGTTATTQTQGDGSTKVATDAYVDTGLATKQASGAYATCTGDLAGTAPGCTVHGVNGVPLCTGFTPTNGQLLQYTTASSPNPCYTAVTNSGGGQAGQYTSVSFSATPTFTATSNTVNSWTITLTGNVTGSTLASSASGQFFKFKICQDATGNRGFVWPTGFGSAAAVYPVASTCTEQSFSWDGATANPLGAAQITGLTGVVIAGATGTNCASNPPSGQLCAWFDATANTMLAKDSSGNIYVMPKSMSSQTSNQWVSYVDATGVIHTAQVNFSNLAGSATLGQLPGSGVVTVNPGNVSCTLGSACTIPLSAVNAQSATYTTTAADFSNYKTIVVSSGTFTITLVASGSQPAAGQYIHVINYGGGTVTIARNGQNINGGTSSITLGPGSATAPTSSMIISDASNYFATAPPATTGSGTVTSVGTGCGLTGGTITTSGTVSESIFFNGQSGAYTVLTGDCGKIITVSATATITLPQAGSAGFASGWYVKVQNTSASGTVTVSTSTSTFYGGGYSGSSLTLSAGQIVTLASDGTNWDATQNAPNSGTGTVTSLTMPGQFTVTNPTTTPSVSYNALPSYTSDINSPYVQNQSIRRTAWIFMRDDGNAATNGMNSGIIGGTIANNAPTASNPMNQSINVASGSAVGYAGSTSASFLAYRVGRTNGMRIECMAGITGNGISPTAERFIPCGFSNLGASTMLNADIPSAANAAYIVYSTTGTYSNVTDTTHFMLCLMSGSAANSCTSIGVSADISFHRFSVFEDIANSRWTGCVDTTCVNYATNAPVSGTNMTWLSGAYGIGAANGVWEFAYASITSDVK